MRSACIGDSGYQIEQVVARKREALCVFEFIYFARPDSVMKGQTLYAARSRMGEELAAESPVEADLVIPVPDTGNSAAIGYAARSGITYGEALIKNRYIGRTFIDPDDQVRKLGIRMKFNPLTSAIKGKRLVVVDDSIVRGNTTRALVRVLFEAGAKEVHLRISSPPIVYPVLLRHRHGQPGRVHRIRQDRRRDQPGVGCDLGSLSLPGRSYAGHPGR